MPESMRSQVEIGRTHRQYDDEGPTTPLNMIKTIERSALKSEDVLDTIDIDKEILVDLP